MYIYECVCVCRESKHPYYCGLFGGVAAAAVTLGTAAAAIETTTTTAQPGLLDDNGRGETARKFQAKSTTYCLPEYLPIPPDRS